MQGRLASRAIKQLLLVMSEDTEDEDLPDTLNVKVTRGNKLVTASLCDHKGLPIGPMGVVRATTRTRKASDVTKK